MFWRDDVTGSATMPGHRFWLAETMHRATRFSAQLAVLLSACFLLQLTAAAAPETSLRAPVTLAPARGSVLRPRHGATTLRMAWIKPMGTTPVSFFVEVVSIQGNQLNEVFAGYQNQPTATISLSPGQADYAWRVYAIGRKVPRYAASEWVQFSVQPVE